MRVCSVAGRITCLHRSLGKVVLRGDSGAFLINSCALAVAGQTLKQTCAKRSRVYKSGRRLPSWTHCSCRVFIASAWVFFSVRRLSNCTRTIPLTQRVLHLQELYLFHFDEVRTLKLIKRRTQVQVVLIGRSYFQTFTRIYRMFS